MCSKCGVTKYEKRNLDSVLKYSRFSSGGGCLCLQWHMFTPDITVSPCRLLACPSYSPTVMSSLQEHSPWGMVMGDAGMHHHPTEYIAWHIRTSEGETATSYDPKVHPHVLEEPASAVCPAYLAATGDLVEAAQTCRRPHALGGSDEIVYISSNRYMGMRRCCRKRLGGNCSRTSIWVKRSWIKQYITDGAKEIRM